MHMKSLLVGILASCFAAAPAMAESGAKIGEEEALAIATEAFIYGYPLVTMGVTRQKLTNVSAPMGRMGAPVNQFAHVREFLKAGFTDVVAPNNDTLYSQAWLDLSREPMILHVPDAKGRYYLLPMLSAWTNVFASPGSRTTGSKARDYAIVGPGWKGRLPKGVEKIQSPTNMVWIIGRTYSSGTPADLAAAHAFQDQLSLKPLSAYGKRYVPPTGMIDPGIDMKRPPVEQVNEMSAEAFFATLAALMKANPPARADAPMLAKLARIGIVPGRAFDVAKLTPAMVRGLRRAPSAALTKMKAHETVASKVLNGWIFTPKTGTYGTDYLQRAMVSLIGLGANLPEDAVYPLAKVDGEGQRLTGANRYVLHFAKGMLPPVKGFWSVTMYDEQMFFVANPIDRYAIHSADALRFNKDGSLDLYIQHESPGKDKESNWLPAPEGNFVLMLRMYWPMKPVLDGTWRPPAVTRSK